MESFQDPETVEAQKDTKAVHGDQQNGNQSRPSIEQPQQANEIPRQSFDRTKQKEAPPTVPTKVPEVQRPPLETDSSYPQLLHNPPELPRPNLNSVSSEDDDEEVDIVKSFTHTLNHSHGDLRRNKGALVTKVGDEGVIRMHKFTLFETTNYFYIVGMDLLETCFRILKIDRTSEPGELNVAEDDIVYTKKETHQIITAINEGNRATGGLKTKLSFWGLLGFIRFTGHYYMIVVTKRSQVAVVGGHYIFKIDKTELIALTTSAATRMKTDKHLEEGRYVNILNSLDLSHSFYFSYSYNVTRTLQYNILREREALQDGLAQPKWNHNDMFVWNHHLLEPAKKHLKNPYDWCLSIVHGYVDQSALSVYWGRVVYITLIARRSRFFAGARYLKRGANDLGYVANDVETEQIVSEMLTTSFHAPGSTLFANPKYTSHVQHRGSIPLHWTQDSTGVSPKPDIHISVVDPFFSAAALHFDNLFQRYGTPIYCLNLIKAKERTRRESKLLDEYTDAVNYLNQFLPKGKKIIYHAWDMSRASKSRDQDVIGSLEAIAATILPATGFFQNGSDTASGLKLQAGVARTNCIDCLDRTNAAQFVIAKKALGYQLQALGVIEDSSVEYDSDAVNLFTHMWHEHGDTIATQYGGSHLVNTVSTYRKINHWTGHSRDMVESFKRFYNNSFMDAQRQEAYNLFLGNYIYSHGQPMLWELTTDYYLHQSDPRSMFGKRRPSYRMWYTPEYLQNIPIPPALWPRGYLKKKLQFYDDYWTEYYKPLTLSSFKKLHSMKLKSNLDLLPIHATSGGRYDLSPFKVRTGHETDPAADIQSIKPSSQNNGSPTTNRKGIKIITPSDKNLLTTKGEAIPSIDSRLAIPTTSIDSLLPPPTVRKYTGIIREPAFEVASTRPQIPFLPPNNPPNDPTTASVTPPPPTKADLALQAFTTLISSKMDPQVTEQELYEYERYVSHPSNIPLVTSNEAEIEREGRKGKVPKEFIEYLFKTADPPQNTGHDFDHYSSYTLGASAGSRIGNEAYAGTTLNDRYPNINFSALTTRSISASISSFPTATLNTPKTAAPFLPTMLTHEIPTLDDRAHLSLDEYIEYIDSGNRDEPLTVLDEDGTKKRYKAYRQWLRGKSLFKQKTLVGGEVL